MATRPRSARATLAGAQQRRRQTDMAGPGRREGNSLRAAAAAGSRPVFAKGTSKAYQGGVMKYVAGQRAGGKRINAAEAHRRGVAGHTSSYAGKGGSAGRRAGEAGDRRAGGDRRRG